MRERPTFPKRAVITAGMPYGNKNLHFGHVAGVFVPADAYARFLRDRIGAQNVIFVSGTDCYGSPIMEGYRKGVESGEIDGDITSYVAHNHELQRRTLDGYGISLDLYAGSGLDPAKPRHEQVTAWIIKTLFEHGWLEMRSTAQFYDTQAGQFLNGRQVIGHCPVQGCKSSKAYADECDLGHQFEPMDLIAPKSTLTGATPELRPVNNWYLKLPQFASYIESWADEQERAQNVRNVVPQTAREFLAAPAIYIQNPLLEKYEEIAGLLPGHKFIEAEKGKTSFCLEFASVEDREKAVEIISERQMKYRTGKALVPFRITGNISWGVPAPRLADEEPLTVWCWPESLWAPISFTRTMLELDAENRGAGVAASGADEAASVAASRYSSSDWRDWWCSDDAHAYQFIGQDNIYFYGIAQTALWAGMQEGREPVLHPKGDELRQTTLVANHHILFLGKKASSSAEVPPPPAQDLLAYYTSDQLRAHWFSLGLGAKSVSFMPKIYDPAAKDNPKAADPALKEGALLTNIFNRLARSCFYSAQKLTGGLLPSGTPQDATLQASADAALAFEAAMANFEFPAAMQVVDDFIRAANKRWTVRMRDASNLDGEAREEAELACLVDAFHELRCAAVLVHPIAPTGCERIREYMRFDEGFWSWDALFSPLDALVEANGERPGEHALKELPPRTDFFERPECQFADAGGKGGNDKNGNGA